MEKQKTSSKRKAAIKVIVAVLLIAIMTGISFAVANFVHNKKSVQASSVKNGLSAYELAVQQGYAGSLDDWLVSLQGKSAYQIAVDNGYSGSEKDWSKTLTAMSKKDKSDISSAAFSEKGDLVITLSDGTKINVGKAVGASGKDGKDGKDGIGIKSAKINDKGELVISYSDGNSVNLDKVVGETVNNGVGIASSIINEKGELVLTYTNGETANLGGVVGKDGRDGKNGADGKDGRDGTSGTDGISISAAVINESGELIISYSDGTTATLGKVVGSDGINGVNGTNGKDGISVSSAEINSEGELVLSFSNGQRANVGAVVGAKGDKGEQGLQGAQGEKGEKGENGLNGSDGIGVKKSEINSAGELVITYTNDLTENLGPVVGAKGDKGDKGDQGVQGEKGEKGERGVQGEKGDAGLNGTDGKDGKDGTGINNIEISNDGNLLITLTNGTSLNLGNIKGEKGDKGDQGEKGDQGIQGEKGDRGEQGQQGLQGTKGADGRGIAKTELVNGELVITYTDGTSDNLGKITSDNYVTTDQLNFTYSLLDSGTYKITGLSERGKTLDKLNIPSKIDGKDVTEIGRGAFYGNSVIKKVEIPNTVTTIGRSAFAACDNLNEVNIPNSVKTINKYAFLNCKSLTLTIPDSVEYIDDAFDGMNKGSVTFDKSKDVLKSCQVNKVYYVYDTDFHEYCWRIQESTDYQFNSPLNDFADNESLLYSDLELLNCTFGPYTVSGTKQKITVDYPILIKK